MSIPVVDEVEVMVPVTAIVAVLKDEPEYKFPAPTPTVVFVAPAPTTRDPVIADDDDVVPPIKHLSPTDTPPATISAPVLVDVASVAFEMVRPLLNMCEDVAILLMECQFFLFLFLLNSCYVVVQTITPSNMPTVVLVPAGNADWLKF